MILADCLLDHGHFDNQDAAKLYGYIFTIIDDNEADLLIDNIKFIDSSDDIDLGLLQLIYDKAIKVANYPNTVKSKQDFDGIIKYLERKKKLIEQTAVSSNAHGAPLTPPYVRFSYTAVRILMD